jgi:hypothetical protein
MMLVAGLEPTKPLGRCVLNAVRLLFATRAWVGRPRIRFPQFDPASWLRNTGGATSCLNPSTVQPTAADRDRTCGLSFTKALLYQLSYSSE